jgi:hypothetical protein
MALAITKAGIAEVGGQLDRRRPPQIEVETTGGEEDLVMALFNADVCDRHDIEQRR